MKVLHLGIDSPFVDFLVAGFERHAPGANELVQVSRQEPSDRVNRFAGPRTWLSPSAEQVGVVVERTQAVDVVVVHAMTDFAALVCAQLPARVLMVWSGFGFDYYLGASGADLYGDRTLALLRSVKGGLQPNRFGRFVRQGQPEPVEPLANDLVRQQVARRTDYFSAPVPADLDVFTRAFPGFRGEFRQLNYGDVASMCRLGDAVARGGDILLGNSSAGSNNHPDALRLLASSDLGSRRVVVPLTYGDAAYRDGVIRIGNKVLGDRFFPVVDHLPIDQYLDLVAGCGVALFMHRRQQGVGNIVAALQQGSHVYLDRRNPLYGWLRSQGVRVQPARSLKKGIPDGPVAPEVLARHRAFLEQMWGTQRVEENLRSFVAELGSRVSASVRQERRRRRIRRRRPR